MLSAKITSFKSTGIVLFFALLYLCAFSDAHSQRIDQTFNSDWLFHKGEVNAVSEVMDPRDWSPVDLPHTWNSDDAFTDRYNYYRGSGWYAKAFTAPAEWKNKQVYLHFEGANQDTTLYLNGQELGRHLGGYTAFRFNLTRHLNWSSENLLMVHVNNAIDKDVPPLSGDWTKYGGIYRNVRLIVTDCIHFDMDNHASDGVFTKLDNVSHERAKVSISGRVTNDYNNPQQIRVQTQVIDKDKSIIASSVQTLHLPANTSVAFESNVLELEDPHLWSPEDPYLYHVQVQVLGSSEDEAILDAVRLPLGLRWFEFDELNRFVLNGEPMKLIGANRHQDMAGKGNALLDEDHRRDYAMIKETGFNFVRLAHYPQAPEVYKTCDESGLLVWTELPIVNEISPSQAFTENSLQAQREHIRQTRNHPSVVFYGYMNEVFLVPNRRHREQKISDQEMDQIGADTLKLARLLEDLTQKEAPGRKTVIAFHQSDVYARYGLHEVTDVVGWNLYPGWYGGTMYGLSPFLQRQHSEHPDIPLIVSEYGPGSDVRNRSEFPSAWDYSQDYQMIMHESYLKQMMGLDFLAGFAAWNFADFGSAHRQDTIPAINQKGLFNYDRSEKEVVNLYRAYFKKEPILAIALQSTLLKSGIEDTAGSGSSTHPVRIFSNAETVSLSVNGKPLGQRVVDDHVAIFQVPFEDGLNRLVATGDNGADDQVDLTFEFYSNPLYIGERQSIAVNVGSHVSFYDAPNGVLWMADRPYNPGLWGYRGGANYLRSEGQVPRVGIDQEVLGTDRDPLFQTFNEGLSDYWFDVKRGTYEVTFHFVEPNREVAGKSLVYNLSDEGSGKTNADARIFNVDINGARVLENLNIGEEYGSHHAATYTFEVDVHSDTGIRVQFKPVQGDPVLSGIRLRSLPNDSQR